MRQTTSVAVPPERPVRLVLIRTRSLAASWAALLNLPDFMAHPLCCSARVISHLCHQLCCYTHLCDSAPPVFLAQSTWLHKQSNLPMTNLPGRNTPCHVPPAPPCWPLSVLITSAERSASQVFSTYLKVEFRTCPPPSSFLLTVSKEPFLLYR